MLVKIHKANNKKIVAICDANLICKKFETRNLQLDLTSSFYKGEKKSAEELIELLKNAYIVNIVGKESISLALKARIIEKTNIIKIMNIPHAQAIIG